MHDLVLQGGRVIDPETGVDAVQDVAVTDGRLAAVGEQLRGRTELDVGGHVVSPGFIDLHSHGQDVPEQRLQALDGVTTALELEGGAHPVEASYRRAAAEGRPIHYGYSASWAVARMRVVAGVDVGGDIHAFLAQVASPAWQAPATRAQLDSILEALAEDLAAGALGIGVLLGYAQDCDPAEYVELAGLAARAGAPTYTHARDLVEVRPETAVDGAAEIVRAAAETGASMHYCHVNSTSTRHIDRVLGLVGQARAEGARVTTEAYPYGAGMTGIGASFLAPEHLAERGLTPQSLLYAPTGERVADAERLAELRRTDPGGLAVVESLRDDRPDEFALVKAAMSAAGSVVASDAMPLHWPGQRPDSMAWPLPAGAVTHPRGAGTYARTFRLVRDEALFDLAEAISRCTLMPARVLEDAVPAMRRKGRIQPGCDADLVVFDPDRISDQATYTDTTRPSTGIRHVLVDGTFVVRDSHLQPDTLPGRPVLAG